MPGRQGAIKALAAAWRLVALFKQPFSENLFLPILHLQDALRKLDEGTVAPMLKPARRRGRTTSTDARAALRGHAAGTVTRLKEAGISWEDARSLVAEALVKLGVRPERGTGQITARTVRTWCEEVAADVGRRGAGAIVYDAMFPAPAGRFGEPQWPELKHAKIFRLAFRDKGRLVDSTEHPLFKKWAARDSD